MSDIPAALRAALHQSLARATRNEQTFHKMLFGGILLGGTVNPLAFAGCMGGAVPYAWHAWHGYADGRRAVHAHLAGLYARMGKPAPARHDVTVWLAKAGAVATAFTPPPPPWGKRFVAYARGEAYRPLPSPQPQRG